MWHEGSEACFGDAGDLLRVQARGGGGGGEGMPGGGTPRRPSSRSLPRGEPRSLQHPHGAHDSPKHAAAPKEAGQGQFSVLRPRHRPLRQWLPLRIHAKMTLLVTLFFHQSRLWRWEASSQTPSIVTWVGGIQYYEVPLQLYRHAE